MITIRIATVVSVQTHKVVVVRNGRGPSLEEKLTVQSSDHGLCISNLSVGGKYLIRKGEDKQRGKGVTEVTIDQAPLFNCLNQSTNFGQPEGGPVCHFRFCFLDIRIRTIQLKHEGCGAFFGLQPARMILWASTH